MFLAGDGSLSRSRERVGACFISLSLWERAGVRV
jgi:hypothetical protein